MVLGAGKTGGSQEMSAKRNATRQSRLTAADYNTFSGKCLQGLLLSEVVNTIKLDFLAGALVFHPQGVNVIRVRLFELFQKKQRCE